MSSNAAPVSRFSPFACMLACLAALEFVSPTSVAAQTATSAQEDDGDEIAEEGESETEESPQSARRPLNIDLSITVPKNESDRLLEEDCEEEADAARIANEIVVCRRLGEATDGSWNKEEWQRRYAEETAYKDAPRTPDTFGIPNHGNPIGFGSVPPPAIFIDVEALPQAPAGSDADRIARGLPPLGKNDDLTAEEIAERRRALGLEAPPIERAPQ